MDDFNNAMPMTTASAANLTVDLDSEGNIVSLYSAYERVPAAPHVSLGSPCLESSLSLELQQLLQSFPPGDGPVAPLRNLGVEYSNMALVNHHISVTERRLNWCPQLVGANAVRNVVPSSDGTRYWTPWMYTMGSDYSQSLSANNGIISIGNPVRQILL
jgi:hypothetical protein